MGLPKTVRLDDDLEPKVNRYLRANKLKFSQLVSLAIGKFISEPQSIELMPADPDAFLRTAKKAFGKHKDAMDRLK